MTTPLSQLSRERAMQLVSASRMRLASVARERGLDVSIRYSFTYRIDEFVPLCGAIAIDLVEESDLSFLTTCRSVPPFDELRGAIKIWHMVSCCRGFGFNENISFWEEALGFQFVACISGVPLAVEVVFPMVMVAWDPFGKYARVTNAESSNAFEYLRDVFCTTSDDDNTMQTLTPFLDSARAATTPIRLKLELRVSYRGGEPLLVWLRTAIQRIPAYLRSRKARSVTGASVVFSGVKISPYCTDDDQQWKWIQRLLSTLPQDMPIEYDLPMKSNEAMTHKDMPPLLEAAIGRVNGPLGRLEVLDLQTYLGLEELGAVCSLLPHSQSVREVHVTVEGSLGWLWLVYAMFHPLSRQTNWNRLGLGSEYLSEAHLKLMRRFLRSRNGLEMFPHVISASGSTIDNDTEVADQLASHVRITACVTEQTNVYEMNKPTSDHHRHTTLSVGSIVELAETNTTDLPEFVHVIVPGHGLGVVQSSCLTEIAEQVFAGPRTSCISALHIECHGNVACEFISEIVSSLRHVRASPPGAFLEQPNSSVELIQMIDGYEFSSHSLEWMQRTTQLHSLGLKCTPDQTAQLASALRTAFAYCTRNGRAPLRALRLIIDCEETDESTLSEWVPGVESLVATIMDNLRSLRSVDIAIKQGDMTAVEGIDNALAEMPLGQPDVVACKLSFLGVFSSCGPLHRALDSSMISHIFAYYGPSLERAVVLRKFKGESFSAEPADEE